MTPTQIEGESTKAFAAFQIYVELDGHITKVATRLKCSLQNLAKWQRKWHWKARFASLRQRETEIKNAVEARAAEVAATITENEKASAWHKAFELAGKFIDRAKKIHETDETAAASLARAALQILESISGGVARGQFNVGVAVSNVTQQFPSIGFDDSGAQVDPTAHFLKSYEQALKVLDAGETPELPCDNWNPNSIHATPIPPENVNMKSPTSDADPRFIGESTPSATDCKSTEAEVEPLSTRHRVPARMTESEIPMSEGATLPSHKMFDNVECINAARRTAGDP